MVIELRRALRPLGALLLGTLLAAPAGANLVERRPQVQQFIEEMAQREGFTRHELTEILAAAELQPEIIEAISRPAEALPWHRYRPIFLKPERIELGVEFWRQHQDLLARAEREYGVPAEILVAILGVETRYGSYEGRHRVIDALATLAFDYPPRSDFFRKELAQYLILMREQGMDPLAPKGSYAGAMGLPQFISSSYRHYAVDFDDSGRVDLWSVADAIGSVANYFHAHGWRSGDTVAVPAQVRGDAWRQYAELGMQPQTTVAALKQAGVIPARPLDGNAQAALFAFDAGDTTEHWLGLKNFYVITRYNHSPLYAMAVYQLSREILARREAAQ